MDLQERLGHALVDRYRLLREVGSGGMAVVFLADDLRHRRHVAIKVMRPEVAHGLGADRFLREIEVAAGLAHPNILPVHDSGEADGLLYFVMPHVEGETLRERLDRHGPLPLAQAVRIASEIGDALEFAHGRGLVHRDVKPENILFQAGHALVCDFGIAKAVSTSGGEGLTRTGVAIGTVKYMSPEQATGTAELDGRSDVYSLGCVLFEMLTGRAPFDDGTPHAILARKVTERPPRAGAARRDVPSTVDDVIAGALAPDPGARFSSPRELTTELARAVTTVAIEADGRRRRRATAYRRVLVAGLALSVIGAGLWTVRMARAPDFERVAVLPLRAGGNAADLDYLVEGMHEDLIRELMRSGVRVINPTSVRRYRDTEATIRTIAEELGVDAVVEGSASLQGEAISLELRMTDGATDEVVWGETFDGTVASVLSLYGAVVRGIASATGLELSTESQARFAAVAPMDPQVQQDLWWARFHRAKLSREGLDLAREYYRRALERDPRSAEALVGISAVWSARAQMGYVSTGEAVTQGESAFARAVELDSLNAEVQAALANFRAWVEWDFDAALQTFPRGLAANPTNSLSRAAYSHLLHYLGRDEEARAEIALALEHDPLNPQIRTYYGMNLVYERDYTRADSVLREVVADEPGYRMALTTLRTIYHLTGEHERALDMWRQTNTSDPEALAALERGYASAGYTGALRSLAELFIARSDTMHVTPWQIGTLYTRAGDRDLALDYLERAFEEHDQNIPYLSVDPIFDYMRDEPRFRAMIRRLGLPERSARPRG